MSNILNVTQIRENLAEILGRVKFGEEIITVEKKGKPYAVIMSPEEYKRYKEIARRAFITTVQNIQAKNGIVEEEDIQKFATDIVHEVRKDMYERSK